MHFQLALFSKWQFYIPQDDEDRDFCMATEFPRLLAAQLLDCPVRDVNSEAVMIVASVIRAKLSNVGRILQHYGISEAGALSNHAPEPPRTPERRRDNAAPSPSPSPAHAVIRSPVPAVSAAQVIRDATTPYQALLIQAVNVARISMFPHKNSVFDMTAISQSLAESTARSGLFRFYVGDQTEWQRMVGAAGELYVSFLVLRNHVLFLNINLRSLSYFPPFQMPSPDGLEITGKVLSDTMPAYTLTTTLLVVGTGQSKGTCSLMT